MIDEVMTLIVAGHETTAAALTWTWYLISQHPRGGRGSSRPRPTAPPADPLGLDAAESLPFTHQVIQEALRLYPPGWLFTRRTIEADELGGFPHRRRAPTCSSAPTCCTGIPAFWSEPEEFRPERFAGIDAAGAAPVRLHSLLGGPAALHRREHGHVRDAGARPYDDAALSPDAARTMSPSNSRRRSICARAPTS